MKTGGRVVFSLVSALVGMSLLPIIASFAGAPEEKYHGAAQSTGYKAQSAPSIYSKKLIASGDIVAAGLYASVSDSYVIPQDRDTHKENVTKSAMVRTNIGVGVDGSAGEAKYSARVGVLIDYDGDIITREKVSVEYNKFGIEVGNYQLMSRRFLPYADTITKGLGLRTAAWTYKTPTTGFYGVYAAKNGVINVSPEGARLLSANTPGYSQLPGSMFIIESGPMLDSTLDVQPVYIAGLFGGGDFTGGISYSPSVTDVEGSFPPLLAYKNVITGGFEYAKEIGDGVLIDVGVGGEFGSSFSDGRSVFPLAASVSKFVLSPLKSLSIGGKIEYRGMSVAGEYNSWGLSGTTATIPSYINTPGNMIVDVGYGLAHIPNLQISSSDADRATVTLPGLTNEITPKTSNVWQIAVAYDHKEYGVSATWMRGTRSQLYAADGTAGAGSLSTGGSAGQSTSSLVDFAAEYRISNSSVALFAGYTSYTLSDNDALKANDSNVIDNKGNNFYIGTKARF